VNQPTLFDQVIIGATSPSGAESRPPKPQDAPTALVGTGPSFEVKVVRSKKRRRTVSARMNAGVLEVLMPAWMTKADEALYVADMVRRFERKQRAGEIDLESRAAALARKYDLPTPATIRWVDNMAHRWGSCTAVDRSIRISQTISAFPAWVVDGVIVHELAHLAVPDHSAAFWDLANRYPKMERVRGYLIARSGTDED
jgi:predicted metal-dependent hydrolase